MDVKVEITKDEGLMRRQYVNLVARAYRGWYQERGFLVLPELVPGLLNSVVIPRTEWLKNLDEGVFETLPEGFDIDDVGNLLIDWNKVELEESFWDAEERFAVLKPGLEKTLDLYNQLFEVEAERVEIQVMPLRFGTKSSFYRWREGDKLTIWITWREDIQPVFVIDSLLSILVVDKLGRDGEYAVDSWKVREEIGEFLLYHSRIAGLVDLTAHRKTLETLISDEFQKVEHKQRSVEYLKELKFPLGKELDVDWEKLKVKMSEHEYRLARCLYEQRGKIVSFDELARELYGENWEEKFSLEYLAKVVEQVRKKLKLEGINQVIFTKRGVGYGWF